MFTTDKNGNVRRSPGFFESHQMLLVQRSNSNSLEQLDAGDIQYLLNAFSEMVFEHCKYL